MSTTNILDLNNRIDALEKAVSGGDSAQANKKDIATEFNTTTNYTAGCFVYYKGKLYQFNADHAAGAWDPTDVVEANVTDQIVSNKAAIDGLTASDIAYDNIDSGMTATDVQGAVDELKSGLKNYTVLGSVDSDGVKTYAQLLAELYTYIPEGVSKCAILYNNIAVFRMAQRENTNSRFYRVHHDSNGIYINTLQINSDGASNVTATISTQGAVSFNDGSSAVIPVGRTISVVV